MAGRTALALLACTVASAVVQTSSSLSALDAAPLPEGSVGIASRYAADAGIASDPSVVFADDFESYSGVSGVAGRWDNLYHTANIRLATEAGNVFRGGKALEFTNPQTSAEVSNSAVKAVSPQRDTLFVRYYGKLNAGFNVLGSSHNGGTISARYCCPGVRADGFNKFLVSFEAWRDLASAPNPGKLNAYIYHPEQRDIWGDHFYPTGLVSPNTSVPFNFGPEFVPRADLTPVLDRWYAYELMVKANTPGQRDGRVAMWLDGHLIADFPNLRLRETTALAIDQFTLDLHVGSNTQGVARKWFDNVVAATSYIGPVGPAVSVVPSAPKGFRVVPMSSGATPSAGPG